MGSFAIRNLDTFGEHEHYVGTDEVLWDWLRADGNAEAFNHQAGMLVSAPEGYVFNEEDAVIKYSPAYGDVQEFPNDSPAITRKAYVRSGPFFAGKALLLMKESAEALTYVPADEFPAHNVDESRIVDVHFFYQ